MENYFAFNLLKKKKKKLFKYILNDPKSVLSANFDRKT